MLYRASDKRLLSSGAYRTIETRYKNRLCIKISLVINEIGTGCCLPSTVYRLLSIVYYLLSTTLVYSSNRVSDSGRAFLLQLPATYRAKSH